MAHGDKIDRRKVNKRNHIIDLFRRFGPLSKARAKDLSHYSMDTIISIFNSLAKDELVVPAQGEQKNRGRKALFYDLDHNKHLYLGTTFNASGIFSCVVSFSRKVTEQFTTRFTHPIMKDEFIDEFTSHVKSIISKYADSDRHISAIGCSIPGDLDFYTGILKSYTFIPSLENIDFKELVSEIAPTTPIVTDHNVKSMTKYLLDDSSLTNEHETILFISARSGAASGLIHNRKVVTDRGEFGHIKVSDEEVECICGRSGCLDLFFSYDSFLKIAPEPTESKPNAPAGLDFLAQKYREGNYDITRELDRRLYFFTIALLNVINVIAPDLVILTGGLFKIFGDPIMKVKKIVNEHFKDGGFINHFKNAEFTFMDIGPEIAPIGICYGMIWDDWGYFSEEG